MKTKKNQLMTFRAFSIGFSVAVLALACGSDSGSGDEGDDDPDVNPIVRETCDDNPLLAGCPLPATDINDDPIAQPPEPPADPGNGPGDEPSAEELARAAAENVLASNCGGCHGPALTPAQASAGMNYINDIERLADEGKIIPLNSAGSRVIERMRNGSMPPPASLQDPVNEADINIVAQFIDNPNFWPGVEPSGTVCPDQLFDYDTLYRRIAQDLQGLDEDDRLTARYITLTNRFTAGVCADAALDIDRNALSKLVNMLSVDTTITPPEPIDPDELIYRIDIEDYGWEDEIDVVVDGNVETFVDSWEAIAAFNPYAVPFVGQDADDAVEDTGTAFPVMLADSLLDTASIGNLYYALIDVDVQQPFNDFILNELEIDQDQNLIDGDQVRAGTTRSRISRQDRVVQRDEIEVRQGVLWQSFDFLDDDNNDSIFENPFDFAEGGIEAIFTLPNGLFGFVIADENNVIVEDSDILLDTNQNNFRAVTSISCSNCHAGGLIPVVDEVKDIAIANARNSGLNADEVEQLREVYPDPAEFARIVEGDSQSFYQNALRSADVPVQGIDPVSNVFFRFDRDISLEDAAGDLGLRPEELENELNLLQPELGILRNGTIDRDDFTQFYVDSLCILQVVGENNVDPDLCQAVADNGGLVP